jgi:predicted component of type VI protein secretion system
VSGVKTTVDLPDDLYRRAKVEAAARGRRLRDLVEEGLELVLEGPHRVAARRDLAQLMQAARGVVDSGVPDLASNPARLAGFGRDPARDR